jgi:hypothetical protein
MPLLDAKTKAQMISLLTTLITDDAASACVLEYPGIFVPCPNPIHSQLDANANFYLSGGRLSSLGECVECGGTSQIMQVSTETIYCSTELDPKEFIKNGRVDVSAPDSILLTRGPIADIQKIRRANSLTFSGMKFDLIKEVADVNTIFEGNFYQAVWERI